MIRFLVPKYMIEHLNVNVIQVHAVVKPFHSK